MKSKDEVELANLHSFQFNDATALFEAINNKVQSKEISTKINGILFVFKLPTHIEGSIMFPMIRFHSPCLQV